MEFTCNGLVRDGFGFDNPNHAAALFVILMALLWSAHAPNAVWRGRLILALELILLAALLATCSRSGLLALAAAGTVWAALAWRYLDWRPRITAWHWAALVGGFGLILSFPPGRAGLTRLIGGVISPDASILNRFKVWQGALKLLADNPGGVGNGNSGFIYTVSLHHGNGLTGYRTMVNSFLTAGVEQGIVVLWLVVAVLVMAAMAGLVALHQNRPIILGRARPVIGMLSALAAGIVAGCSSTCFDLNLLLTPCAGWTLNDLMQTLLLGFFVLIIAGLLASGLMALPKPYPVLAVVMAGSIAASLICAPGAIAGACDVRPVVSVARYGWLLTVKGKPTGGVIRFVPASTNPTELTSAIAALHTRFPDRAIAIPLPQIIPDLARLPAADWIASALPPADRSHRLVIFHPEELPPDSLPSNLAMVILDGNDAKGVNRYWRENAEHCRIFVNKGVMRR
jgi:hypothetical protein